MDSDTKPLKVLMCPWLAYGHISPFLELAKKLSDRNFHSYICSTPANLNSIRNNKIPERYALHIHLVELNLPSSPDLPPQCHTTNGVSLNLHCALRKALKMAKPAISELLETLRPDLLMHDILLLWAGELASLHNIPSVSFFTSGAANFLYFAHLGMHPGIEFPFQEAHLSDFELLMALNTMESAKNVEKDFDDESYRRISGIIFINTSREMEGKYIDYLSELIKMEIIPIGALASEPEGYTDDDKELMDWLGKKDRFSSVFVSFGSEYFLEKEDIEEIAYGLELSTANFIWIIRFPKGDVTKIKDVLPKGFLERVGERGRIIEKWAPQGEILSHSSTAGFVSHCGWNSLKESIYFGVPIIAMPMHRDQPMNAKLVVELGVGMEVKRDGKGRLQRDEVAKAVKDVVADENGERLRRQVAEEREKIRLRSREEIEAAALKLAQLCGKSADGEVKSSVVLEEESTLLFWH